MRICFYAPFKPLHHPNPSGDLIIATGLHDFLQKQGHKVMVASTLRSRWIYWKPWLFLRILRERFLAKQRVLTFKPDIWLTYHSYYKSPDFLGPGICKALHIPYIMFQGIYSTKRRRRLKTAPGFYLNRHALQRAEHVFTNRQNDLKNLQRIIPEEQLSYIKPGIFPEMFQFEAQARIKMRLLWQVGSTPVILSAAMFRPDVKTRGLIWLIKALGKLADQNVPFKLVIAGSGSEREKLTTLAHTLLPGRVIFTGKIKREKMAEFYSGGDIFAFPGIRESLGMVYLEAQSCKLPVIAFDNGGIPEVVQRGTTAQLIKPFAEEDFCTAIKQLLHNEAQRNSMGRAAEKFVRREHDLHSNYRQFEQTLRRYAKSSS
jgi:glycosyltransferase involved in cell wall biosynthesis